MDTTNKIRKQVEALRPEMIEFAKRLINIPTVNPPGNKYEECVDLIEEKLKSIGLKTKRIIAPHDAGLPRINLIAEWNNNKEQALHLNGHYDVVPVTSNWTKDPFKPVVRDGRLYGRGAADMKSGLAMMIFAVQAVKEAGIKPKCNISLSFTPDEETGGQAGVEYLVRNQLIKADAAIVAEPTYRRNTIHFAHKGVLWLEVAVLGKSAHASRPDEGINAFEKMMGLAAVLEKNKSDLKKIISVYRTDSRKQAVPTMVMGGITAGGTKINTVPDKIMFTIDRRIIPDENLAGVKEELIRLIKSRGIDSDIKTVLEAEPAVTPENEKICKIIASSIKKITKRDARFRMASGFMDMRFFVNQARIPCVVYGPEGSDFHGDDESVDVESFVESTKILAQTIADFK